MTDDERDDLKDRAVRVFRYVIRRLKPFEIARIEKIPRRTVFWLIQEGGRILGGDLKRITEEGLYRELFFHHDERKRELWLLYSSARKETAKVACLARLAEEDRVVLDLAERMKIIEAKPQESRMDISLEHRIDYDKDGLISRLKDLESRIS